MELRINQQFPAERPAVLRGRRAGNTRTVAFAAPGDRRSLRPGQLEGTQQPYVESWDALRDGDRYSRSLQSYGCAAYADLAGCRARVLLLYKQPYVEEL